VRLTHINHGAQSVKNALENLCSKLHESQKMCVHCLLHDKFKRDPFIRKCECILLVLCPTIQYYTISYQIICWQQSAFTFHYHNAVSQPRKLQLEIMLALHSFDSHEAGSTSSSVFCSQAVTAVTHHHHDQY
jgi:hypothetical protein